MNRLHANKLLDPGYFYLIEFKFKLILVTKITSILDMLKSMSISFAGLQMIA